MHLIVVVALCVAQPTAPSKKVLIIGIDGCRPDALLAAKAPHLHRLIETGAFSDRARTGDITVSGPGWASLLTGVWRDKHGVRDNNFEGANFRAYPDVLARVKQARPAAFVASVVHWAPIRTKIVTAADQTSAHKTDAEVARVAGKLLAERDPDVLFVHFDDVDHAGHAHGFSPTEPKYVAAITTVDGLVGQLLDAVKRRKGRAAEDWLILVSTDHGGSGKSHGKDIPEHRTIFLIVHGSAAVPGRITPPPAIVDVAPTALRHLGVPVDPAWKLDGRAVGLKGQ
jgi:predicted AlkP superfamily pyrophosphatase or phosphodiesterase